MVELRHFAIAGSITLCACTQQLKPLDYTSYTAAKGGACSGTGLTLTVCQADTKSRELAEAYFDWKNDPALWDIPLVTLATGTAGLLLFDGPIDAIKAVGLGAGAIGVGRSYFTPAEVQAALLDGSNGYACLADAGRVVNADAVKIANMVSDRNTLNANVRALEEAAKTKVGADKAMADTVVANGKSAIALFDKQAEASKYADSTMRSKARAISTGLLKRVRHKPVDFSQLYQSLAQSAKSAADFQLKRSEAQPAAGVARAGPSAGMVETETRKLLNDLPNIETSIGKFDGCVTNSLAGSASNG